MSTVISTTELTKDFRTGFWKTQTFRALDRLNLGIQENEIFGYLGPNGAGKSTTLKLLMSLIYPSSGSAMILGRSVSDHRARQHAGYLPETPFFYEYLTAEEFLSFYAGLFDLGPLEIRRRVSYYLHLAGVYEQRKLQLRKFSKGMIQRVGIVQALLNDPQVVFLDEPMSGLDPIGRRAVRDLILKLKKEGKTVFFSTHILNDVETVCDRVGILNKGRLIGSGLLKDLVSKEVQHIEVMVVGVELAVLRSWLPPDIPIFPNGSTLRLDLSPDIPLSPVISQVEQAAGKILSINPVRQTMEEFFFSLLEKKPGEGGRG
jgi:ABC-2 type transport system ATP-binding protein